MMLLDAAIAPHVELLITMGTLLGVCFLIGTAAVVAGVGGGVMFVPLATALFAIHVDYIRGAGLMVALVGSIAAAPSLMQKGLSRLRISIPMAVCGSVGSILGARLGLAIPDAAVLIALALLMLGVAAQTAVAAVRESRASGSTGRGAVPRQGRLDGLVSSWNLRGSYIDPRSNETVDWNGRNAIPAMILFIGVGVIGGVLGVGGGWANVPVLTGVMGLPVKLAAATSGLIIVANSSAASWVYLREGALDALIVVPAVTGMILGTRVGARLLGYARPVVVRVVVVVVLLAAGLRTLAGVFL
jgi:uncharacterized membrane protein YfcA